MSNKESKYYIAELIYKSISKTISPSEQVELDNWLAHKENLELYLKITNLKRIQSKLSIYEKIQTDRVFKSLEEKISLSDTKEKQVKIFNVFKLVAVLLVLLGVGYVFKVTQLFDETPVKTSIEHITLQLDNGEIKVIKSGDSFTITNNKGMVLGSQEDGKLVYNQTENKQQLRYNTLTVPYGKQFELVLSDGTTVNLNAGTSLKYPVKFLDNQPRQVFLIGEAYFNVTKDKEHPFIVNTNDLNVEVLGTQFNFSSYPEDQEIGVVLVEGSVNLYTSKHKNEKTLLQPGFMGVYNRDIDSKIYKKPVITDIYTAWIDGELVFRNMTLDAILKKMERHFNVKIVYSKTDLSNEKFNASFRNEPIEKILEYFKITYNINYQITENKVHIN